MEHRKDSAKMEPNVHARITPINDLFAIEDRREVIKFLNSRPSESLLKATVATRKI